MRSGTSPIPNSIDPLGRKFSFLYDTNGIDLLEVRQTRAGHNDLLFQATYNSEHRPIATTDAAGQTTTYTYNARAQMLTETDPKHEIITYKYDANGYLIAIDGRLPGASDTAFFTYDPEGRVRTITDVNGYTLTFDYDNLNRLTRTTYPDGTFRQDTYDRLDLNAVRDRAGRYTFYEHDAMRQLVNLTDPLGRETRFDWCRCGSLKSVTDPLGRTTSWLTDVQGRRIAKLYGDGSQVRYRYQNTSSRLQQVIDEKQQYTHYTYNLDNTLKSISYDNASVPTPNVSFTYDADYRRLTSMTDGTGTTTYSYLPITGMPVLGAGKLTNVTGPLANDTSYAYDELGRCVQRGINGVSTLLTFDAAGRVIRETNELGSFAYSYDGASDRLLSEVFPNGQKAALAYGSVLQDLALQRITYQAGATPISEFLYTHDVPRDEITSWSQQAGAQTPSLFTFGYDAANQLVSAAVTNSGAQVEAYAYVYDPAGNRLAEHAGPSSYTATYNALNQLSTSTEPASPRTNEWDAAGRLVAVNIGNRRTELTYDGLNRVVAIRQLVSGAEISRRQFVWSGLALCEEHDASNAVIKRFFPQGMKIESGPNAGNLFYTRDHLKSIRELTDDSGNVRARYAYDPYGRRTKLAGDLDANFGFAGMFWSREANLFLTHHRAYDPDLARWLSRDPLFRAEIREGPNLYAYVQNNPVNLADPSGLGPLPWTLEWLQAQQALRSPAMYQKILQLYNVQQEIQAERAIQETAPDMAGGDIVEATDGDGELVEVTDQTSGELTDQIGGEITDQIGGELMEVEETTETVFDHPASEFPSGLFAPVGAFVGAGITVLTMTDCNTVNGILGLVRQGKGGLLNVYEDEQMKQLERMQ